MFSNNSIGSSVSLCAIYFFRKWQNHASCLVFSYIVADDTTVLIMLSVSTDFPSNSQRDSPFHRMAYDYSRADLDGLRDHLRDVTWEDIFKLGGSAAAASEFYEWVRVGIDVYIPHRKYQVKPHSSPWFSASCAAAIVHRNLFFLLHQKDKSYNSKVKFRQASNCCQRVLEAAKLACANKTKESIPRNLALVTFGELPILFSTKVNLL